jgi:predicted alpha/beta superfamily hydrolase
MRTLMSFFSILIVSIASAQMDSIDRIKTEPVVTGYSFKFHSKILKEDRTIMVALPSDYNTSLKEYPVFYITDGQWNFKLADQAIGLLSENGLAPRMILIAVQTLENRDRNLTPTRDERRNMGGNADDFYKFFKDELIPWIEQNYRTYPFRVLSGTSLGGLFVTYVFTKDPNLFNSYLSLSPSMWWDDGFMLKRTDEFLTKNRFLQNYLYTTVANEGLDMGVNAFAEILAKKAPLGLTWKFDEHPEEIHETISYKGIYSGLRFIFSEWNSQPITFTIKGDLLFPGDSVVATFNSTSKLLRYTLDGTVPAINSTRYKKPVVIKKPIIIKVIPVYGNGFLGNCDSLVIRYLPKPDSETNLGNLKNGLNYSYYEGEWDILPDFEKLVPVNSGEVSTIKITERKRDLNFALRYASYIDIPTDNTYTFYLSSDDGSRLIIGKDEIVTNDGLHAFIEKSGKVYLRTGKYPIEIQFFQQGGGFDLSVSLESPDIKKQVVPDSMLYIIHK